MAASSSEGRGGRPQNKNDTNDFRALLSTFLDDESSAKNSSDVTTASSMRQSTERVWRATQLRRATEDASHHKQSKSTPLHNKKQPVCLAVCVTIVDHLEHESIWRHWATTTTTHSDETVACDFFIHAKHPERISSSWVRSKLIDKSYKPNWNDVRVVRAMLAMAAQALQNSTMTHVLFCTESCIPIATMDETIQVLQHGTSFVSAYGRDSSNTTRFDERECFDVLQSFIPTQAVHKALPGWCVLSREHIQDIVKLDEQLDLWTAFEHVWAPEEVYFPTALSLLGHLEDNSHNLLYAEWNARAAKETERAHPKVFDREFGPDLVERIRRQSNCLFLRKLKRPISIDEWQCAIAPRESSQKRGHEDWSRNDNDNGSRSSSSQKRSRHDNVRNYERGRGSDPYAHGDNYYRRDDRSHNDNDNGRGTQYYKDNDRQRHDRRHYR